jgi:hypothetical protein
VSLPPSTASTPQLVSTRTLLSRSRTASPAAVVTSPAADAPAINDADHLRRVWGPRFKGGVTSRPLAAREVLAPCPATLPPPVASLVNAAAALHDRGQHGRALLALQEARRLLATLSRRGVDDDAAVWLHLACGDALESSDDSSAALEHYLEALRRCSDAGGDGPLYDAALLRVGTAAMYTGDLPLASHALNTCLSVRKAVSTACIALQIDTPECALTVRRARCLRLAACSGAWTSPPWRTTSARCTSSWAATRSRSCAVGRVRGRSRRQNVTASGRFGCCPQRRRAAAASPPSVHAITDAHDAVHAAREQWMSRASVPLTASLPGSAVPQESTCRSSQGPGVHNEAQTQPRKHTNASRSQHSTSPERETANQGTTDGAYGFVSRLLELHAGAGGKHLAPHLALVCLPGERTRRSQDVAVERESFPTPRELHESFRSLGVPL